MKIKPLSKIKLKYKIFWFVFVAILSVITYLYISNNKIGLDQCGNDTSWAVFMFPFAFLFLLIDFGDDLAHGGYA